MHKVFKTLFLALLIQSLLMGSISASERVESVVMEDDYAALEIINEKKNELRQNQNALYDIDKNLRITRKGQSIYLKFKTIAGSLLVVGIIIGSYKASFPPGFRAMLGAYVTVTGISHGFIKLSDEDVAIVIKKIGELNVIIQRHELNLNQQTMYHCKRIGTGHSFCPKEKR